MTSPATFSKIHAVAARLAAPSAFLLLTTPAPAQSVVRSARSGVVIGRLRAFAQTPQGLGFIGSHPGFDRVLGFDPSNSSSFENNAARLTQSHVLADADVQAVIHGSARPTLKAMSQGRFGETSRNSAVLERFGIDEPAPQARVESDRSTPREARANGIMARARETARRLLQGFSLADVTPVAGPDSNSQRTGALKAAGMTPRPSAEHAPSFANMGAVPAPTGLSSPSTASPRARLPDRERRWLPSWTAAASALILSPAAFAEPAPGSFLGRMIALSGNQDLIFSIASASILIVVFGSIRFVAGAAMAVSRRLIDTAGSPPGGGAAPAFKVLSLFASTLLIYLLSSQVSTAGSSFTPPTTLRELFLHLAALAAIAMANFGVWRLAGGYFARGRPEAKSSAIAAKEATAVRRRIAAIHDRLSKLDSLEPGPEANDLFTELVTICLQYDSDAAYDAILTKGLQKRKAGLQRLCSEGEFLLERYWAKMILDECLDKESAWRMLESFPYYQNYLDLTRQELGALRSIPETLVPHKPHSDLKILFIGSGPLPLTSIVLAKLHEHKTPSGLKVHNVERDAQAVALSTALIERLGLSDKLSVSLGDAQDYRPSERFDTVFLAGLVGLNAAEKDRILKSLLSHLPDDVALLVRSAHRLKTLLYPEVGADSLTGVDAHSLTIPIKNGVVNSVVVLTKQDPSQ